MGIYWETFKQNFKRAYWESNRRWYWWAHDHGFAWGSKVARYRSVVNIWAGFDLFPNWLALIVACGPFIIIGVSCVALQWYVIYKVGLVSFGYLFPASDAVAQLPSK